MSDELFPIHVSVPDRLTVARRRYAEACAAYDEAMNADVEFYVPLPKGVVREHLAARLELEAAELADISARKIERNAGAAD